jgi:hypothetical protein
VSAKKAPITYWDADSAIERSERTRPKRIPYEKPKHFGHLLDQMRTFASLTQVCLTVVIVLKVFGTI